MSKTTKPTVLAGTITLAGPAVPAGPPEVQVSVSVDGIVYYGANVQMTDGRGSCSYAFPCTPGNRAITVSTNCATTWEQQTKIVFVQPGATTRLDVEMVAI